MTTRTDTYRTPMPYPRVAGFMFLFYIAIGITQIVLGGSSDAEGLAAKLANMVAHAPQVRLNLVLGLLTCFVALTLAVALYVITRDQDPNLALLALLCRVGESLVGGAYVSMTLGLLALATSTGADAPDSTTLNTLGAFLRASDSWSTAVSATFFAVGSTFFCWLLLQGRLIPVVLAWVGLLASIVLVVGLPLQLAGLLGSPITGYMWLPMAVFEIPTGLWLLIKGVSMPAVRNVAPLGAD